MPPALPTHPVLPPGKRFPLTRATAGCVLVVVLATGVGAEALAGSASEARRLLERMTSATRNLNYDGDFVYRRADSVETMAMRIIHRRGPDGERERLVALNGVPREVLRDGEKVTCYLPDDREVWQSRSEPRPLTHARAFEGNGGPGPSYALSTRRGTRVAGRQTDLVEVRPRDEYRYGYRLWVDRETGLLLKSELVDAAGKALEIIVYTRLQVLDEIPDRLLEPENSAEGYTWYRSGDKAAGADAQTGPAWQAWLPSGFEQRDYARDAMPKSQAVVEHLVFSDGLASVSVFIEERRGTGAEHLSGLERMGAVNAYGTTIDGVQVTVVGEVPAVTVEKIGKSLSRR
ncbi:MAG: MucB/RseB C-terminal domain-containing protein [Gammaproteobacteria bacterium]|nr:MucB/RseB C-terminal domain-containing protein [Gammaproteobacteria bacterium]